MQFKLISLLLQFKETIFYYLGYQSSVSHDSSEIILIYIYIFRLLNFFNCHGKSFGLSAKEENRSSKCPVNECTQLYIYKKTLLLLLWRILCDLFVFFVLFFYKSSTSEMFSHLTNPILRSSLKRVPLWGPSRSRVCVCVCVWSVCEVCVKWVGAEGQALVSDSDL